jgi:hypothetical protein
MHSGIEHSRFGDEIIEIDPVYVWGCNISIRKNVRLKPAAFIRWFHRK